MVRQRQAAAAAAPPYFAGKVKLVKMLSFRLTGVQIAAGKQAGVFLVL